MTNYPKPIRDESLQDYLARNGIELDELRIIDSDPVTHEVYYAGYGWYGGEE